ncbi:MAG: helix-turn-helix transcriptional regulator [Ruminococcaceae bacterium]|nr:helix-turn-helix transcriptional regulator [Oscillospiraceae bacterium]
MMSKRIGENILTLRRQNNLTQKDVATILKISNRAVSKWEKGQSYPNMEHLDELSRVFGVSIDCLMHGEGEKL